jgi:hypothetical protein
MLIILSQDAPFDISVYLDSGSEQYCVNEDDITGSLILHCPTTAEDDISGSVLMKEACVTIGHEAYDMPFANSGNYSPSANVFLSSVCIFKLSYSSIFFSSTH